MGRAPRRVGADLTYHVTMRGNRREPIFLDDQDRRKFLSLLDEVAVSHGWHGWAWCLMDNHVHLCLTTTAPDLSAGMRDVFGPYARFFNWKHQRGDHLFGSRFHSVDVTSDRQLMAVIRYAAHNPVRAGLVDDPLDWQWSSLMAVLDPDQAPGFVDSARVLAVFHEREEHAKTLLRQLLQLPSPDPSEVVPAATLNVAAIAQLIEPRQASALLLGHGVSVAEASRRTGVSRGAIRAWQANGFRRDGRRHT